MAFEVLIIDDDSSFRKILELRLKSFINPLNLTAFENLSDARNFFQQNATHKFLLAIIDQHLPDGRGIEFLAEGWLKDTAVLSVSSDDSPQIPGDSLKAGAAYFLNKSNISQPLFKQLVEGILERDQLLKQLNQVKVNNAVIESVKTLVSTLRHEINNPLGAVLGAAYLLRNTKTATAEQLQAAELVENSGKRIQQVLEKLCDAMQLDSVTKADQKVFHIPGDKPWK